MQQAGFAELLARRAARFRNAVRKQNHAIARGQLRRTHLIIPAGEDAQHGSALPQSLVRAVGAHHEWRVVPGVDVSQSAGGAVQSCVEKRDEAVAVRITVDDGIQPVAQEMGRNGKRRETAHGSLLMSNLQAAVRGLSSLSVAPHLLCNRLNSIVYRNTDSDRFITFFYAQLDGPARQLAYVNAGHNPPFVMRSDGSHERLRE